MARNDVQYIAPQPKVSSSGGRAGGGKFGQVIGAAVGGTAGALAGAPGGPAGMVAGGMAGAAGGASLGGMVGNMVDPGREAKTAISQRIQSSGPQIVHSEQSEKLKQSLLALNTQPEPLKREYMAPLVKAYVSSIANDNQRVTA